MRFLTLVTTLAAAAPLMAAAPPTNALFADGGSPIVFVGGKKTPLGELAGSLGDDVSEEATRWAAAADSIGAGLHVVAGGRVLLVTHSTKRKLKKELALIGDTLELVDELLPARPVATNEGADQPSARRMPDPSDEGVLVLLQPKNDEEYGQLLEVVVEGERYLQAWKDSARRLPGFTISRPAVAMWIELLDGQEEFDIRNELVHRLAHLAIARRFGELPYWLQTGLSWLVEEELLGAIYCFPYRDEFVWATEHTSWDKDLAREFKKAKGSDSYFAGLAAWKRGSYRSDEARQAFGMARFLMEHHREDTPQLLSNLFHLRATKGVKSAGRGWELIPGWEPDAKDQRAEFERVLGEGILSEAAKSFAKGKRYKKPRKR